MRVLHITATYLPSVNGVALAVSQLKQELETRGVDVVVLAPKHNNKRAETGVMRYPSLPNPFEPDFPLPLIPFTSKIFKQLRSHPPDLVHVHHPFHIGFLAAYLAHWLQVPLVFTYHTRYVDYARHYLPFLPFSLKKQFIRNQLKALCRHANLVVSPSQSLTQEIKSTLPTDKVVTIPTGLPQIPRSSMTSANIRKTLQIGQHKKVLLTVCRVSPVKNLAILINSLKYLDDSFVLVLVGGGSYLNTIKQQAKAMGIADRVRFMGLIPHDELGKYYQTADIFAYPSITETQGLVFLEAMRFTLPIVAVDSAAAREWVKKSVGVLTANNARAFARGIISLKSRDRKQLVKSAHAIAEGFNSKSTVDKILTEYKRVSKRNSNRAS